MAEDWDALAAEIRTRMTAEEAERAAYAAAIRNDAKPVPPPGFHVGGGS